jgi:hypothetical protein
MLPRERKASPEKIRTAKETTIFSAVKPTKFAVWRSRSALFHWGDDQTEICVFVNCASQAL